MRTFKRAPNEINTSLMSYNKTVKFFNQMEWKGLIENKNTFTVDQYSQADAKNVYVDDHGSLVSRKPLQEEKLPTTIIPEGNELIDKLTFGHWEVYCSKNSEGSITITISDKTTEYTLENITKYHIVSIENYIICFNDLGAKIFDVNNSTEGWQDFNKFVEIPVFKRIVGNTITEYDKNQFTNKYIEEYIWSNISQPILPEKQRANVTINSNGIENKWLLDQADILTNYRLLKEIYYKPELDQWGNTTSDVSMAKGIICITQNDKVLVSFNNGDTFTTYWYPEHGKLLGIHSISDDGSSYFFVALDAVYRLNLDDGTWTAIHVHDDSNKTLGEIYTYSASANAKSKILCHFLTKNTFVFVLWANGLNTQYAEQGCDFPVLWFMGPWLAGYDSIPYADDQDFNLRSVPKFKTHVKIAEEHRGQLGCSVALARQYFTWDTPTNNKYYWGNLYESAPRQLEFAKDAYPFVRMASKSCVKIFLEDGYVNKNMSFSDEPSSTTMPGNGTPTIQKFATIMCAGFEYSFSGFGVNSTHVAIDNQVFILPGYFCGDYVYNNQHFTEALDIKPFWNNRIISNTSLSNLPPLAGRIGYNIVSENSDDYTYSPKLATLSAASYKVATNYNIYGLVVDSITQSSTSQDGSIYEVTGKMFFTNDGSYHPSSSYAANGWRKFTWLIGRQTGTTAADTLLNELTIDSTRYLEITYIGYDNKKYTVPLDFFTPLISINDRVGIVNGALYYLNSSNKLTAQYITTDSEADDINNPWQSHKIGNGTQIVISDNSILIRSDRTNGNRLFVTNFSDTDQAQLDFEIGEDKPYTDVPTVSFSGTDLYLGFDNYLAITSNTRKEESLIFNLPTVTNQYFRTTITNLINISTTDIAVFFEDKIIICSKVEDSTLGFRYDYYPTKLSTGTRLGDSVINTIEGSYTIFPTKRGLAFMNYQAFMATTDQILTYITDNIEDRYNKFYAESDAIKMVQVRDKLYMSNGTKDILIYDLVKGQWWFWQIPENIKKLLTDQIDLQVITNTLCIFKDHKVYKDFPYTQKAKNIDWFVISQPLHLRAANYYKNLKQLVFHLLSEEDTNKQHSIIVQIQCYRKRLDTKEPEIINFKIDELRTFVKRFNYWKINEVQYGLANDTESIIPTRLRLNGIGVKYEIGEEVK